MGSVSVAVPVWPVISTTPCDPAPSSHQATNCYTCIEIGLNCIVEARLALAMGQMGYMAHFGSCIWLAVSQMTSVHRLISVFV